MGMQDVVSAAGGAAGLTTPCAFSLGTGTAVVHHLCARISQLVREELVLVTCFWAQSESLISISSLLRSLSGAAVAIGHKIRVRICLSSVSFLQKLTHTWSSHGYVYDERLHASRLSLPAPVEIPGIDLSVKSIFILPFSVMHPKYIIVDRKTAFLPSSNVSWEDWFEGALEFHGQAVDDLFAHWVSFWSRDNFKLPSNMNTSDNTLPTPTLSTYSHHPKSLLDYVQLPQSPVSSLLLPSTYHRNPRFRPFPFKQYARPPKTALNVHTLERLRLARTTIFLTTPNITSPPFLEAVLEALSRGVDVHIVTNDRLMTLEQLVTAGTTTPRCAKWLVKQYRKMLDRPDEESQAGLRSPGRLCIDYYRPRAGTGVATIESEAVKLHLKCMIVDGESVLLGSGNQDRASWYTSQELGILVQSTEVANLISKSVHDQLADRMETMYAT